MLNYWYIFSGNPMLKAVDKPENTRLIHKFQGQILAAQYLHCAGHDL